MGDGEERCAHEAQPGTVYTRSNLPGRFARAGETVDAVCGRCGQPIRADAYRAVGPSGRWYLKPPPPDVVERVARFRARHPEIHVRPGCRTAVWMADEDAIEITYSNPRDLIERLEAEFDRPGLAG